MTTANRLMQEAWARAESITNLDIIEEPGTGLPVVQCAYCSKGYLMLNEDDEPVDLPSKCRRCGAPMNWDGVHGDGPEDKKAYANKMAEAASKTAPRRTRNRMVQRPEVAKQTESEA